jgi:predicted benzoate:H+ symporter BenE
MPVQPMKAVGAIAATQAAQTIVITTAMVWGARLATGVLWLVLGLTGMAHRVANLVSRPVVSGIILGLGLGFMIEGAKMMSQNWWVGGSALLGTSMLLTNRVVPAMFMLLVFGAGCTAASDPTVIDALRNVHVEVRLPAFTLSALTIKGVLFGTLFLALPQVALTLGNAIIAITEENNRLFPNRPVNESRMATSTGLMNLLSASHNDKRCRLRGNCPACHVYVPDQPGFGGSGHPEDVLDMAGLAGALADWMRSTGSMRPSWRRCDRTR